MKSLKTPSVLGTKSVLISIHPQYVGKILSGEKRWEFRRNWPTNDIETMLIYSTLPTKRITALVEIGKVVRASKSRLWDLANSQGGGISRRGLFAYLDGKEQACGLELKRCIGFGDGIEPRELFGNNFRAPQSFRYLKDDEMTLIGNLMRGRAWA